MTDRYKVSYSVDALDDLREIYSYIANELLVPETAAAQLGRIRKEVFEVDDVEMTFDDATYISDARDKANGVIAMLKSCGWIEYEQETNHQLNVVIYEHAIPMIESMNRVIREEEAEYQGIISQIHASLQNKDLYSKPYELIIKGVQENTERLLSELKKLNASIKRHMEKQTNDMGADEILNHFFEYYQNIGSKAYLRMKTSENISYFRSAIIERLEYLLETLEIMDRAVSGYMEVEEKTDETAAYDSVVQMLLDVKSSFYRLDDIIDEIDRKHTRYMRNAVMRAKFLLATGNNLEGKLKNSRLNFQIETEEGEAVDKGNRHESLLQQLQELSDAERLAYKEAEEKYRQNRKTKTARTIAENFAPQRSQFLNEREELLNGNHGLRALQMQFNQDYTLDFMTGMEGMAEYREARQKLQSVDIIHYEAKLKSAKEDCEEVFRSDFGNAAG